VRAAAKVAIAAVLALAVLARASATTPEGVAGRVDRELAAILRSLDEAGLVGGPMVKPLVDRLNEAIALLDKAQEFAAVGDEFWANILTRRSLSLIEDVRLTVRVFLRTARSETARMLALYCYLVLLLSLTTTEAILRGRAWYVGRERRRLRSMAIRRRREE